MNSNSQEALRIAQVEALTGVGAHTLRVWERRYGVPAPDRTGGRQRMYTAADVQLIRRMRDLSQQGVPLARAAEISRAEAASAPPAPATPGTAGISERMTRALLHWDEAAAAAAWTDALETFDIATAFSRVVVPTMRDVGQAWHDGEATVAQEHFATNFIRARLDLLSRQVTPLPGAPSVLLACVEGEHHEVALLMLAVMLRFQGLRTVYLGQNVPTTDLVRTVEDSQPQVVALNAGSKDGAARLPRVAREIEAAAPLCSVVFGGAAFDGDERLRDVPGGTYLGADLTLAVAEINRLGRAARPGG